MTDYQPIPCRNYAELELAILHRRVLRVGWREVDGHRHLAKLRPLDLFTRDHEEYLVAKDPSGGRLEIRLDRIIRFVPITSSTR